MTLSVFKNQDIEFLGEKYDGDLFIMEKLFPVLLEAMEKLSKEVEIYL
jgi:hypothetical protein